MLYLTDLAKSNKLNVICCNLINNGLKFNTILDAS